MRGLRAILHFFFPLSGRLSRGDYVRKLFRYMLAMLAVWLIALATRSQMLGFVALAVTALVIISGVFLAAQRCRDLGWPGWAVLFTIVPWGGELLDLVLYFKRGMRGSNRYGPDPYGADGEAVDGKAKPSPQTPDGP